MSTSAARFVRVLYSFNAEEAGELSVRAGEVYLLKGACSRRHRRSCLSRRRRRHRHCPVAAAGNGAA